MEEKRINIQYLVLTSAAASHVVNIIAFYRYNIQ